MDNIYFHSRRPHSLHDSIHVAFPMTIPEDFFADVPSMNSRLGSLEYEVELFKSLIECRIQRLKEMDQSDVEWRGRILESVQTFQASLEDAKVKLELEKERLAKEARKQTTKVPKQHQKKLKQVAKSGSGKPKTKVPKQKKLRQRKVLET